MNEYVKRNQRWINPFFACLVLSAAPVLMAIIDPSVKLPGWISTVGLILGGLSAGIGAAITETMSAKIVRFLGSALAISVTLVSVFR